MLRYQRDHIFIIVVTMIMSMPVFSFTCLSPPDGAPSILADDCRHLISRIPSLRLDPGVLHTEESLFLSLLLPVQGYRNPAYFKYKSCVISFNAMQPPHAVNLRAEHYAFYIWNAARDIATALIAACVDDNGKMGWEFGFSHVPGFDQVSYHVLVLWQGIRLSNVETVYDFD